MESVLKFESPSSCVLAGPSSTGKSSYVFKVLKHANGIFTKPPEAIIYCYGVYQALFDDMKKTIPKIEFHEGVPTKDMLDTWFIRTPQHKLLILDDLMQKASKSEDVVDIFCQYSHHLNFTCWLICQNIFNSTKQFRTISLNAHYFLLFRSKRDENQLYTLFRQIEPGNAKYIMESYRKATAEPYNPLVLDLSPHSSPMYKVRMHVLPGQLMTIFLPDK